MENTDTSGEAVPSVPTQEFLEGPRPGVYHRRQDKELQTALLHTLGTQNSIKYGLEGLTNGKISTIKNRVYRAAKRIREEHPNLRLRTRVAESFFHAWLEE